MYFIIKYIILIIGTNIHMKLINDYLKSDSSIFIFLFFSNFIFGRCFFPI